MVEKFELPRLSSLSIPSGSFLQLNNKPIMTISMTDDTFELNDHGHVLFSSLLQTAIDLKRTMLDVYPYLIETKVLTGEETHDEINDNTTFRTYLLTCLAKALPKGKSTTTRLYGRGLVSEWDLYHNGKTNDSLEV
jgi:hypothetical protein